MARPGLLQRYRRRCSRKATRFHPLRGHIEEPRGGPPPSEETMQTQNPILDEIAKLTTAAMGLAQAAGDEAKAALRSQTDRMVAELDLVRRDDHEALKA